VSYTVLFEYQDRGVESMLIKRSRGALEVMGASGCVVLTDPDCYRRFGFKVVDRPDFAGAH
jgi:predicted N-acetyltransferase YhbS